jgi:hypothetical protein
MLLGAAYSPLAANAPPQLQPYVIYTPLYYAPNVPIGFLNNARAAGRLPKEPKLTQAEKDEIGVRLSVLQSFAIMPQEHYHCDFHTQSFELRPKNGSVYFIPTEGVVISSGQGSVQYVPQFGQRLTFVGSNLDLTIKNASGVPVLPVTFCNQTAAKPAKGKSS